MTRQMRMAALALVSVTATAHAQGDVVAGEKVFLKCRVCHQVGETAKNAVGPKLNGLFGRKAGTIADYSYSECQQDLGDHVGRSDVPRLHQGPQGQHPWNEDDLRRDQGRKGDRRPRRLSQAVRRRREEEMKSAPAHGARSERPTSSSISSSVWSALLAPKIANRADCWSTLSRLSQVTRFWSVILSRFVTSVVRTLIPGRKCARGCALDKRQVVYSPQGLSRLTRLCTGQA